MKKIKRRKSNNDHKAFNKKQFIQPHTQDKPIKPNYVSGIEAYVRKGQVLHACKIMRDTNEMSLAQCKDIIDEYRETGNWDHFKYALHPKDLAKRIVDILRDKNLLSADCSISGSIYIIDKVLRENL